MAYCRSCQDQPKINHRTQQKMRILNKEEALPYQPFNLLWKTPSWKEQSNQRQYRKPEKNPSQYQCRI
jgi:hypothetical protein